MQYEFFLLEFLEHFEFKCVGCFDPYKNLSRKDNFCDRKVKANCACVLPFNTPFCLGTCPLWGRQLEQSFWNEYLMDFGLCRERAENEKAS